MGGGDWLGLDIGGANIKYYLPDSTQGSVSFELWRQPDRLAAVLAEKVPGGRTANRIVVTMTGELADCFESKSAGVRHICDSVMEVADTRDVWFYQTSGKFVQAPQAIADWQLTAASNWHALSKSIGKSVSNCIVVDIGSTTTDVIPVRNGEPVAIGLTDFGRLKNGELVYSGTVRSPICALLDFVTLDGSRVTVAQEHFATMLDAWLVLGKIAESEIGRATADGRPATRLAAMSRLARMVCCDRTELTDHQILELARQAAQKQTGLVAEAIETVSRRWPDNPIYVCVGEGSWLAKEVLSTMAASIYDHSDSFSTARAVSHLAHLQAIGR